MPEDLEDLHLAKCPGCEMQLHVCVCPVEDGDVGCGGCGCVPETWGEYYRGVCPQCAELHGEDDQTVGQA